MKYTVTGGTGFIGTELVKKLLSLGHSVIIADIREPKDPTLKQLFKFCDVTDPFQVQEAIKGQDVIFHLAANPDPGLAEKNPRWDLRINVYGTLNVIDACKEHKVRMIFTSTAAINYAPISCYAISKRTAEKYILRNIKKGLNASILRFNNVYGPTQTLGYVIPDFMLKLKENPTKIQIRGTGLDLRDFLFIEDVIDAVMLVVEKGELGQIYEIGTGDQLTMIELAKIIGIVMNQQEPQVEPSTFTNEWVRLEVFQDLEPIKKLGWEPKYKIEEGIKKLLGK